MSEMAAGGVYVLDIDIEPFTNNRAFDIEEMKKYPGAETGAVLAERLRARGFETVTADVFLANEALSRRPAVCVSNHLTRHTHTLLAMRNVIPVVCMTLESPLGALDFYFREAREASEHFHHVFFWKGMRSRSTGGASFHEIHWPYPDLTPPDGGLPWRERRFVALVNSNKRVFGWPRPFFSFRCPRRSLRMLRRSVQLRRLQQVDEIFRSDLYAARLRAIRHFSGSGDFDLYGRGWDDPSSLPRRLAAAVTRSFRGEIAPLAKVETLKDYRFCLCFENTALEGYITEKIFDCLAAGCIPVYLGAPDVEEHIPPGCFVDVRRFPSLRALEAHMRGMSDETATSMLENARDFLVSERADVFRQEHFVGEMLRVLSPG